MHRFNILSIALCLLVIFNHINSYEAACNCPSSMCCSRWGYCGTTADYCGAGCQAGKCWPIKQQSLGSESYSGRCTYYNSEGRYTACGSQHNDNEYIVAMNAAQFDPYTPNGNPNYNSLCNKKIRVKGPRGTVVVRIVDRCAGCPYGGLDFSPAVFKAIAGDLGAGAIQVTWKHL